MLSSSDIHNHADCFSSFSSNLYSVVKNYYFGVACKLRGEGKLLPIFFDLIEKIIDFGQIAAVDSGGRVLLARITQGFKNRAGG